MTEDDTFDALKYELTEDEKHFGRKKFIYCAQHLNYHMTGWCTVSNANKIALEATTSADAYRECIEKGLELFR